MPPTASFDKGAAIEEWTDTRFFRPIGLRIARLCFPTGISPDHVTMMSLVTGLVAGRLCFYDDVRVNALGAAMFVVSDIFDSADGQLARMRGTSTRFGKILDGLSDGLRFANLYIQLILRVIVAGGVWWLAVPVGVLAGLAHARQSGAVDYIRQLYMFLAEGGGGEFNLPEDFVDVPAKGAWARFQVRFYHNYHSMRYVRESLVIRLHRALPIKAVQKLSVAFHDICVDGDLSPSDPLPEELDYLALPRLVLHFNRMNCGRLRQLIDQLNKF